MGMPRRMQHYWNLAWHPYLIIAAAGTAVVLIGIILQGVQLVVSIRRRDANRDLTGDPWNGRTLEWATSSPPAPYNFAAIPAVHDIDVVADMKERGISRRYPGPYHDISMPKNAAHGPVMGALAFLFGFAMVWYIWWLAAVSFLGIVLAVVIRSTDDETDYTIPAAEVKKIEDERYEEAGAAHENRAAPGQITAQLAPEA